MSIYDKTSKVLSETSRWGRFAGSLTGDIATLISGGETSAAIRDRYYNGFFGDTTQYTPKVFSRLFDEPTYLTFRIEFDFNTAKMMNVIKYKDTGGMNDNFDYMPEPFLSMPTDTDTKSYSTYEYLNGNLGETKRANMLKHFIAALKDIQDNYPYYFTEVVGIDKLSSVNTERGVRIPKDTKLVIKCYEGLDMKITQLMQMYRKIVWDDVYQRWILPDMMRFFTMKIYVSELRLFHTMGRTKHSHGVLYDFLEGSTKNVMNATSYDQLNGSSHIFDSTNRVLNGVSALSQRVMGDDRFITKALNITNQAVDTVSDIGTAFSNQFASLCSNAINNVMPTLCYECHLCEFDITDTTKQASDLYSSRHNTKMVEPEIVIKVGQVEETQVFPLNATLGLNGNKYTIDPDFYISDNDLRKEATVNRSNGPQPNELNDEAISATIHRMGKPLVTDKDSYRIFGGDRANTANSLFVGAVNAITRKENRSKATDSKTKDKRPVEPLIENPGLFGDGNTFGKKRDKIPANLTKHSVPHVEPLVEDDIEYNNYDIATIEGHITEREKPLLDAHNADSTIRTFEKSDNPSYPTGRLISESHYNDLEKLSIATSSFRNLQYLVYDNKIIDSLNIDEDAKKALKDNLYSNILQYIAQSPDADANVRDMASAIIDLSSMPKSAATEEKGFAYLNGTKK